MPRRALGIFPLRGLLTELEEYPLIDVLMPRRALGIFPQKRGPPMKGKISLEVLKHRLNAPQGFRDISTANAGRPWPVRPRPSSRGLNAPQGFRDISTGVQLLLAPLLIVVVAGS